MKKLALSFILILIFGIGGGIAWLGFAPPPVQAQPVVKTIPVDRFHE